MIVTKTFSKLTPVAEGSILKIFGINTTGYGIFIENQDDAASVIYTFQESTDGTTWTDITFTVNAAPVTDFTLIHNDTHFIKVTSSNPYVRLTAYGDAVVLLSVAYYLSTNTGTSQIDLY